MGETLPGSEPDPRRALPSVDGVLAAPRVTEWVARWGRSPVREAVRRTLEEWRQLLAGEGERRPSPSLPEILAAVEERLLASGRPSLRAVLNGTGVVLHTNLGRAPLGEEAMGAVAIARAYSNLEFDLEAGARGSRYDHCAALLCELSGAEAALVVNNNAAAVALAVNELAAGREVVVSRGELVEIGGSFRMPEVIGRSGAQLVEVGTTNRTRLRDYRRAIGPGTGALLKVHPSNYRVKGFVGSVSLEELVALGREASVPVVYDLGSGLLRPQLLGPLPREAAEPGVAEAVASGADLVSWSGDKLLGGPQAGILVGMAATVDRLRANPLLRAFRVDKMTLAALEATLLVYRDPSHAASRIPALRMLREPATSVEARAREALGEVAGGGPARVDVRRTRSLVGGGAYPGAEIESAAWAVTGVDPEVVERRCRHGDPPLLGRVEHGAFLVDFRTLLPGQEPEAARVLREALAGADAEP
ncbi:MAG: L-seryl-tRNA(Sec) selenium transferase [Gemmatimonadota bacterium]